MTPTPKALRVLEVVSILLFAAAIWMVFFYAPLEAVMGAVQKVFYFHVATAWVGMLGFIAAGISGIVYLRTKNMKWDIVEVAAVEISLVFFFIAIVTRFDLGLPGLGHLVDLGPAPDHGRHPRD